MTQFEIPFSSATQNNGPRILTILPTYQCTAACRECCFECSPHVKGRIPLDRILAYIDEAAQSFSTLRLICFSGGECFLLGKDLDIAIARASSYGLMTRCVTNGYWAITESAARKRVEKLRQAGLTELNFSTGDEHQEFVPYSRVVNGAIAGAEAGLRVVIVVEGSNEVRFTIHEALSDERLAMFLKSSPAAKNLRVMSNIWMSFHADRKITQPEHIYARNCSDGSSGGCTNILNNIVVTPHEQLASCCGLTMEHIPEMKLGDLREHSMKDLYYSQFDDFLKIWISLDGPQKIYRWATEKDPTIPYDDKIAHICHSCVIIYKDERVRRVLLEHYKEKVPDVMFRYYLKRLLATKAIDESIANQEVQLQFGA